MAHFKFEILAVAIFKLWVVCLSFRREFDVSEEYIAFILSFPPGFSGFLLRLLFDPEK
jgi:hypothetical protein